MTTRVQGSGFRVQGAHVVRVLLLALLATAVLPPAAAWWLNAQRVDQTTARVADGVHRLQGLEVPGPAVWCGIGRRPGVSPDAARARSSALDFSLHDAWMSRVTAAPDALGETVGTDGWGRCLLLRVDEHGTSKFLVSAGPNGVIETPLDAQTAAGDDIGALVR